MNNRPCGTLFSLLLFLSLVLMLTSCDLLSSTPTSKPVTSSTTSTIPETIYSADIIGRVIVADKVIVQGRTKKIERTALGNDRKFWIIEIDIKNKSYEQPINSVWDRSIPMPQSISSNIIWSVMINDLLWSGVEEEDLFPPTPMSVQKGQSGKTIFLFIGNNIDPSNAVIRYAGEEPFSYGKLTKIDEVAVYDWDLKSPVKVEQTQTSATTTPVLSSEFSQDIDKGQYQSTFMNVAINDGYITIAMGLGNFSYKYRLLGNNKAEFTYLGSSSSHIFDTSPAVVDFYQIKGTGSLILNGVEFIKTK